MTLLWLSLLTGISGSLSGQSVQARPVQNILISPAQRDLIFDRSEVSDLVRKHAGRDHFELDMILVRLCFLPKERYLEIYTWIAPHYERLFKTYSADYPSTANSHDSQK